MDEQDLTMVQTAARRAIVSITAGLVTLLALLWLGSLTGWTGW